MASIASNPIFIIGAHKSGTSFLRNLFDGHPDLAVIPIESHYFEHAGYKIDYHFRRHKTIRSGTFFESALKMLQEYKESTETNKNPHSDFLGSEKIDIDVFKKRVQKYTSSYINKLNEREIYDIYFSALFEAFDIKQLDPNKVRVVEKSVENAEFVSDLIRIYPKACFIHIVRDPFDNLASFRRYRQNIDGKFPKIYKMLNSLSNNYYYLASNERNIPNYKVVRYEDIRDNRQKTMQDLSKFLGIDYQDLLLEPTSLGKKWSSNTTLVSHKNKDIYDFEMFYVYRLYKNILQDYGYKKRGSGRHFWKPVKNESPKTYFVNRFYKYYL